MKKVRRISMACVASQKNFERASNASITVSSENRRPPNVSATSFASVVVVRCLGRLTVRGVQGHVAYPEKVRNPIHLAAPALAELAATRWDDGNAEFPPTSFQISNINAGTGALNVVPGSLDVAFNFRFCTASTAQSLRERTEAILRKHGLDFSVAWDVSGEPFLTRAGKLREAVSRVIEDVCGITPTADTGGGTSDARFIAPLGAEVVEVGPVNASIHKIDEHIALDELKVLPRIYERILDRLFVS